jgi:hypothetical protein
MWRWERRWTVTGHLPCLEITQTVDQLIKVDSLVTGDGSVIETATLARPAEGTYLGRIKVILVLEGKLG